jgi:hypothetical protein
LCEPTEIVDAQRADRPNCRFCRYKGEPPGKDAAESVTGDRPSQTFRRAPVFANGKGAIGQRLRFFDGDDHGDDFLRRVCSVAASLKSNIDANRFTAGKFPTNRAKTACSRHGARKASEACNEECADSHSGAKSSAPG